MSEKYEEFGAFSPPWVDFTQILKEKQNAPNKYLDLFTITLMEEQKQQLKISILSFSKTASIQNRLKKGDLL